MRKNLTRAYLIKEIRRLDSSYKTVEPKDDEGFKTALILLASIVVGPNIKRLATYTGLSRWDVSKRSRNLRHNRVWVRGRVHGDWFDKKHGGVAFWADVCVADGLMNRAGVPELSHA